MPHQFVGGVDFQRAEQHRQPQVQAGLERGDRLGASCAQILFGHVLKVGITDPTTLELVAISVLRKIRKAAEEPRAFLDRLGKWKVFKGVESIVVNGDRDGSL